MANQILAFAPTDTGTNLLTQSEYSAAPDRTNGNQPGVASSKLVNKAIRQSAYVSSQFAQFLANMTGADILDDATPARLLAQINATIKPLPSIVTRYLTGSGTFNKSYVFFIATGSATVAATYTNNGVTYTVSETVASGVQITMTGNGAPTVSGTLTKASGTGDATLTFYAQRSAIYLKVKMVGGGGGGGGSSAVGPNNGGAGGAGGNSTFGTTLLVAGGGGAGPASNIGGFAAGGTASLGTGPTGIAAEGSKGGANSLSTGGQSTAGAIGGISPFGGSSSNGLTAPGLAASANSGSGGGGATAGSGVISGCSGASGGYIEAQINSPSATYTYAVGAAGTAGTAGTSGTAGGVGGTGLILVEEYFQ